MSGQSLHEGSEITHR